MMILELMLLEQMIPEQILLIPEKMLEQMIPEQILLILEQQMLEQMILERIGILVEEILEQQLPEKILEQMILVEKILELMAEERRDRQLDSRAIRMGYRKATTMEIGTAPNLHHLALERVYSEMRSVPLLDLELVQLLLDRPLER